MLNGQRILTVILGAGASHGSATLDAAGKEMVIDAQRPPLTSGLFANEALQNDSKRVWRQIASLIPQVHGQPDFEARLEAIMRGAESGPDLERVARQLRALRFYLRDLIWEVSNRWWDACAFVTAYTGLLWQLEAWRSRAGGTVNLVTFNYDPLLERALEVSIDGFQGHFDSLDSYINLPFYRLYKVHGSVTWEVEMRDWVVGDDVHGSTAIKEALTMPATDVIRLAPAPREGRTQGGPLTMPAIAVPTLGKEGFSCPPSHLDDLRPRLAHSDFVLAVGWQGRDTHFGDLWTLARREATSTGKPDPPRVLVIDPSGDVVNRVREQLQHTAAGGQIWDADMRHGASTFAEAVHSGLIAEWLEVGRFIGV